MAVIRITVEDGKTYEINPDKLTLGEGRVLKRDFGLEDFENFNAGDIDILVGLLTLAIMREQPERSQADVQGEVEALEFVTLANGLTVEEDPTVAGEQPASEMTPETSGVPS